MELKSYNFDLWISITGHRIIRIDDLSAIKAEISKRLIKLKEKYQGQSICLLSGLAEGADRLVVEIGLQLGIPYKAILPMAFSKYIADFETQASLDEFNYLLKQAISIEVLPTITQLTDENRNLCYQQLAVYLANNTDVLMALWDGDTTEKPGGTSQVVRYFREINPNNECFEHILTRR